MKGGSERTTTVPQIPPELQDLYRESSARLLQQQRDLPLSEFMQESGRFQTAPRAGQFQEAQNLSGQLYNQPAGTRMSQETAQRGVDVAGRVDPQFGLLRGAAADRAAINRADDTLRTFQQGITPLQNYASQVPGTFAEVRGQADPRIADLVGLSDRQVTGANIQQDPAFQAAIQAFESTIMPTIQNQAALSGLGRSTGLGQSLAAGQAQYLLPVIQDTLAREERGLERGLGARQFGIQTAADLGLQEAMARERGIQRGTDIGQFGLGTAAQLGLEGARFEESRIGRELDAVLQQALAGERGTERQQQALQFLSGTQASAGAQDLARQQQQFQQLFGLGESEQAYSQGARDRDTQEYLRRQALAEQSLFGPFGQIAPSAIGQQAVTSGGKK